ncbi:hypothetical protein GOE09_28740 [Sinorhizobium medicae]|nr:hypothetical protein [Sinorhizobium meliloti]MDX0955580.1 hypothetical protein [Sinorhizobium medicae]
MNVIDSTKLERDAGRKRHTFLLIPLRCSEIPLTTLTAGHPSCDFARRKRAFMSS